MKEDVFHCGICELIIFYISIHNKYLDNKTLS